MFPPDSDYRDEHLSESDTRSKLIDPALHLREWTEAHIRLTRLQRVGGLPALEELGEPREVLRQTKERMFEA